ncbi:hypothetical protein [Orenia metallireducens]|uniref:hypothetical protein n=1 Tax=Orenia metallireducens TaxID=1413210 RepID=UPI00159F304D|nr:hypothetical protein [Orenia metallireducens]
MSYFESKFPEFIIKYLTNSIKLSKWFEENSKEVLGQYTEDVEYFLREKHKEHL